MTSQQRRVLITGAGSGLGRALAIECAERGWKVAVTDLDVERARETRSALASPSHALALDLDVTRDEDFVRASAAIREAWGGIDVLVNNAGIASAGTVRQTSMNEWRRVTDINLLAVVRGCHLVLPEMLARESGHVVNIASFAGIANAPGMAAYNAAKAAVISLSESLRHEVCDSGIGVSVACPAFFRTNLVESMVGQPDDVKNLVHRLMDTSGVTAKDVARDIADAIVRKRFLVITHRDMRWMQRVKRWMPETFFRLVHRETRGMVVDG